MSTTSTVVTPLRLWLVVPGGPPLPVAADLLYDPADPFAVRAAFQTGDGSTIEWTFARELLTDGTSAAAGEGDVQIWPARSHGKTVVCLGLSSPSGQATFEAPLPDVADFLARSYAQVPTGTEQRNVDWDTELSALLDGDAW